MPISGTRPAASAIKSMQHPASRGPPCPGESMMIASWRSAWSSASAAATRVWHHFDLRPRGAARLGKAGGEAVAIVDQHDVRARAPDGGRRVRGGNRATATTSALPNGASPHPRALRIDVADLVAQAPSVIPAASSAVSLFYHGVTKLSESMKPSPRLRRPARRAGRCARRAFAALRTRDEARALLSDLCTPAEVRSLAERWQVARLLDAGELTYREIHDATGVSTTTIVRVARFLRQEDNRGYRLLLDRLKGPAA